MFLSAWRKISLMPSSFVLEKFHLGLYQSKRCYIDTESLEKDTEQWVCVRFHVK